MSFLHLPPSPSGWWWSIGPKGSKGGRGGDAETTEAAMALRPAGLLRVEALPVYCTTNASPDRRRLVMSE